jgi:hypothetical protein
VLAFDSKFGSPEIRFARQVVECAARGEALVEITPGDEWLKGEQSLGDAAAS